MKEGWKEVRLGEVCLPTKNVNWKNNSNSFKYIDLTSVSRLTHKILGELVLITADNAPSRAKQIVKCDDLIFGTTRPTLRRFCLITPDFDNQICSTGFCVLRPSKDKMLPKYLYYIFSFNDIYTYLEPLQKGANYPAVTNKNVLDFTLPLPPLPEQERIVGVLDSVFASIEQMKQNARTNLINAQAVLKNALDELMQMKEGWEEVCLEEICTILDSQRKPITKSKRKAGVYPYYGASGIVDYVDGYLFDGEYLLISEDGANLLDRTYPIAFTIRGKNWVNNHAHVLSFEDSNLRTYVEYYINSQDLSSYISGCAQPKLNQAQMKRITIPLPPLPEQQRIVAILDDLSEKCKRLERNYRRIIDDCEEMKQAILTRAMNGEI